MRVTASTLAALLCGSSVLAQGLDRRSVAAAYEIEITLPGSAVVRDSAAWTTLWNRFGPGHFADTGRARRPAPRVDFNRNMLVIVAGGPGTGCGNEARYVERVFERRDSVLVDLGPSSDAAGPVVTCAGWFNRIDIVRLPRSSKRVAFLVRGVPHRPVARWWAAPDLAMLTRASREERGFFLRAWAKDPRTPAAVASTIARMPSDRISGIVEDLLKRPDVQRDPLAVASLAVTRGFYGVDSARRLLFDRHATAILGNPRTSPQVLGALIDELALRTPTPEPIAIALARHPGVQANRELLLRLIRATGTLAAVRVYACTAYGRKFQIWERVSGAGRGAPDMWENVSGCESVPPGSQ